MTANLSKPPSNIPVTHAGDSNQPHNKRQTHRLITHWHRICQDKPLPAWIKFNPAAFDDVWQQCCVWQVQAKPQQSTIIVYNCEFCGEKIQAYVGDNLSGMMYSQSFLQIPGARIIRHMDEVVHSKQPLSDEGVFYNEHNKVVKFRSCLLPFGDTGGRVSHVVVCLTWAVM